MDKTTINGVELTLMPSVTTDDEWVDYGQYLQQVEATWLRLSKKEPPLNPRLIGLEDRLNDANFEPLPFLRAKHRE
jgi:hypothetical protein